MVSALVVKEGVEALRGGSKQASAISVDLFKYDFMGLTVKLIIYFTIAYAINKFFEAIIFGSGIMISAVAFFGVHLPSTIPEPMRKFFTDGISIGTTGFSVKFWDIVKIVSVLLVLVEMMNYIQTQKQVGLKPNSMTLGVFAMFITLLSFITFPELVSRIQEVRAMSVKP